MCILLKGECANYPEFCKQCTALSNPIDRYPLFKQILYHADPNCHHDIRPQLAGGVKCVKCGGWFCY